MSDPRMMQQQLEEQRRKVDVDNYIITVRELIAMAERKELHRAPDYQRKFRWDIGTESRLIESLLLGLPVPNIFLATNEDGTWEVVDGLQRVSTLIHFVEPSSDRLKEIGKEQALRLTDLRKLSELNDLAFAELPPPMQLGFTKRGIGVTALSDKSDPETRFDAFERLNRGALALSPQEVRACIFEGSLNNLLRELAEYPGFKKLVKLQSLNEQNATREELVLKFFAYLEERTSFRGAVSQFLNGYMERHRDSEQLEPKREIFVRTVDALFELIGGPLLRPRVNVTPQNELEAVMVAAAEVLMNSGRLGRPVDDWLTDTTLVEASTGATNTKTKLDARIKRAKELLAPA